VVDKSYWGEGSYNSCIHQQLVIHYFKLLRNSHANTNQPNHTPTCQSSWLALQLTSSRPSSETQPWSAYTKECAFVQSKSSS